VVRALGRLATARVRQEARAQEQTEALGRSRSARPATAQGERKGSEAGTGQTAAGVCRVPRPPVRGLREPSRAKLWAALGRPSAVLTTLRVERSAGGMSQRAIARALDNALG
jgi:hypothetical protein